MRIGTGWTRRAVVVGSAALALTAGAVDRAAAHSDGAALGSGPATETTEMDDYEEATITEQASGTFDVEVKPVAGETAAGGFPRHTIAKRFHGDLEATSEGVMMSVESGEGSGAYVAIEHVSGTLAGRQGTFTLVHRGTMRRGGDFRLAVDVVPDSGSEGLVGLEGRMDIVIADGEHRYELRYSLPDAS